MVGKIVVRGGSAAKGADTSGIQKTHQCELGCDCRFGRIHESQSTRSSADRRVAGLVMPPGRDAKLDPVCTPLVIPGLTIYRESGVGKSFQVTRPTRRHESF